MAANPLGRVAQAAPEGGVAVARCTAETALEDRKAEVGLTASCSFQAVGGAIGSWVWLVLQVAEAAEADTLSETAGRRSWEPVLEEWNSGDQHLSC